MANGALTSLFAATSPAMLSPDCGNPVRDCACRSERDRETKTETETETETETATETERTGYESLELVTY